jgi:hypothetical protein
MINTQVENTDTNGQVVESLIIYEHYTISSGLEAISFSPIYDTGEALSARSPITIEAQRLVSSAEAPCRIVVGGSPNIYFSSTNESDHVLSVPLTYSELNSIYSVTGQAVPPESFSSGTSGFIVPEEYFRQGEGLTGVWKFLGQNITLSAQPEFCTDRGVPGECSPIDPVTLRAPINHTKDVVIRLVQRSLAAAKAGRWKGSNGSFSVPFLKRGAAAIALMEKLFPSSAQQNFVCPVTPLSCTTYRVSKARLINTFSSIFKGRLPRGLESIVANSDKEIANFKRQIKKVPDSYTSCR